MDRPETVAILCGGRGTRLQEKTEKIPKPLVEIGGKPIVWHVIGLYAAHGFRRFALLTGYKRELIEEFVVSEPWPDGVEVRCLDTGTETPTGGRIALAADELGEGTFALTYGDGVSDVDLAAELDFHRSHGSAATVALVQPHSQWGMAVLEEDDRVSGFVEKPKLSQWINGGFFFFERAALDYLDPEATLEREPLESLAADGELHGFRHTGFWDCMDTYKDAILLNDLWREGSPPWRTWEQREEGAELR
ncbi:MAG: sugar phosphate nucleotidyltransferase [Solirubrobacterales bacterium]